MDLLKRGKFLSMLDMPALDTVKTAFERRYQPFLDTLMVSSYDESNYGLTIDCAEVMFYIDPFNDRALLYKTKALKKMNKIAESQETIRLFKESYYKNFGEDYSLRES